MVEQTVFYRYIMAQVDSGWVFKGALPFVLFSRLEWKKSFVGVDKLVGLNSTLVATTVPTRHSAKSTSSLLLTVSTHVINVTSSLKTHSIYQLGSNSDFLRQILQFHYQTKFLKGSIYPLKILIHWLAHFALMDQGFYKHKETFRMTSPCIQYQ